MLLRIKIVFYYMKYFSKKIMINHFYSHIDTLERENYVSFQLFCFQNCQLNCMQVSSTASSWKVSI